MRRWSELITDMLNEMDVHLSYIDKVRARTLCMEWNSALPNIPNLKSPQLPWLLQTVEDNEGRRSHGLFNLTDKKTYEIDLPELQGRFLKGSSHGWLAMLYIEYNHYKSRNYRKSSPDICLINPLTGSEVLLPPRNTFPDVLKTTKDNCSSCTTYYLSDGSNICCCDEYSAVMDLTNKIITSSIPSNEDCVVVAIYGIGHILAWCTPGQEKWTPLDIYEDRGTVGWVQDIIFCGKKLYVVNRYGTLLEVDNIGQNAKVKVIVQDPILFDVIRPNVKVRYTFLAESSKGSLIMIIVLYVDNSIDCIKAYKLDLNNSCWRLANNLGDDSVFLGFGLTFSVPAIKFPGCKGNCIYFTENPKLYLNGRFDQDHDLGIYNMEDGSIERIPGFSNVGRSLWPQPIWVMPPTHT